MQEVIRKNSTDNMNKKPAGNTPLLVFLLTAVLLLGLWFVVYHLWLKPIGTLDNFLTGITAKFAAYSLAPWYTIEISRLGNLYSLNLAGTPILGIARNCNGLEVMAIFAGFIAAFPGSIKHKLWYLPAGIVALFVLNIIRCIALTLVQLHYPQWLDFNHKFTFVVVIYGAMFYLWYIWVNRFSSYTER